MTKISTHFTELEVVKSSTALRLGIDNSLPDKLRESAVLIAEEILEPIRVHFGVPFSPQSWYRGPRLNAALNGSKSSDHLYAKAVDIEIIGVSNLELAKFIEENLTFNQLILEYYNDDDPSSGWVHCSHNKFVNSKQASRFDGRSYKKGLEG